MTEHTDDRTDLAAEPEDTGAADAQVLDVDAPEGADVGAATGDGDAQEAPQPDAGEAVALADALAQAERTRDEYLDHLRRERAEFENYRRRTAKERMDALDRGAEQVVTNLLSVLDNFGFALAAAETSEDDSLAKGVRMVHDQLVDVLRQAGLEEITPLGREFDPVEHEAMLTEEATEPTEDPIVTEVLRAGYRFKGRVLRPASVKVAR
jgi:molecular chaperone GrpE